MKVNKLLLKDPVKYHLMTFEKTLLQNARKQWSKCKDCRLSKTRTKVVFGAGSYKAQILIIGEAPGPQEDKEGKPFIGKAGNLLRKVLRSPKIDLEKKCFITNTVGCFPKKGYSFRKPFADEIEACSLRLDTILKILQPEIVVLLGNAAFSLIGGSGITKNRGWQKRHERFPGSVVFATFHPSYLLRQGGATNKSLLKSYYYDWYRIRKGIDRINGTYSSRETSEN